MQKPVSCYLGLLRRYLVNQTQNSESIACMIQQDANGQWVVVKFVNHNTCERCMLIKDAFIEIKDLETCIEKAEEDNGENLFQSEWQFTETVVDKTQAKLWKPSTVAHDWGNWVDLEQIFLFLTEFEYNTFFRAESVRIKECKKGTLIDFPRREWKASF